MREDKLNKLAFHVFNCHDLQVVDIDKIKSQPNILSMNSLNALFLPSNPLRFPNTPIP